MRLQKPKKPKKPTVLQGIKKPLEPTKHGIEIKTFVASSKENLEALKNKLIKQGLHPDDFDLVSLTSACGNSYYFKGKYPIRISKSKKDYEKELEKYKLSLKAYKDKEARHKEAIAKYNQSLIRYESDKIDYETSLIKRSLEKLAQKKNELETKLYFLKGEEV